MTDETLPNGEGVRVDAFAGLADYLRAQANTLDVYAPSQEINASIETLRGWADAVQAARGVGEVPAPQEFYCNKCGYFGPVQVFHERPNGSGKCDYMAVPMKAAERRCELPPPGWSCSREPGHDGPCAASSTSGVTVPLKE